MPTAELKNLKFCFAKNRLKELRPGKSKGHYSKNSKSTFIIRCTIFDLCTFTYNKETISIAKLVSLL